MKPTFIKIGAVLSSLALATSFVGYQSRGKSRMMSGSKSSAASAAATSYAETEDVTRESYNAAGELEISPQPGATSATTTRPLTAEEQAAIRKELTFSSKPGKIFDPGDAAPAQAPPPAAAADEKADQARQELARKVLMFSSKDGAVFQPNDVPASGAPQQTARAASSGNSAQPANPARPAPRRTIMPGSKVMIIQDMPIDFVSKPQPQPKPAQRSGQPAGEIPQQQQRRVLLPSSKSGGFHD